MIASAIILAAALAAPSEDRALVAMTAPTGVYLSWRLLATDPQGRGFDVYRQHAGGAERVNTSPVTATTDFVDAAGNLATHDYYISPAGGSDKSAIAFEALNNNAFAISTGTGSHGKHLGIADLDGDGRDDFVMRHSGFESDPYYTLWRVSPSTYSLNAFTRDGQSLWRYDMGKSIEMGTWFSPYALYDLDKDGRAELIVKAGDETLSLEQLRDETGRVTRGPEYLRVIDGANGQTVLAQADWPDRTGFDKVDPPGTLPENMKYEDFNRKSRNFITVGLLDGVTPHIVVNRGTYGKHKVAAFTYAAGKLTKVWSWENVNPNEGGNRDFWGQGAHILQARDVNGDGKDEVVIGSLILNGDGTPRMTIGHGHSEHVDHAYLADIDPTNPGLEMYYGAEHGHSSKGAGLVDLDDGKTLWAIDFKSGHLHDEGLCADIDSRYPGTECYSHEKYKAESFLHSADGRLITRDNLGGMSPKNVWWDADPQKEIVGDGDKITSLFVISNFPEMDKKYQLPYPNGVTQNDRQYIRAIASVDILGDYREELIASDRGRLIVYVSDVPATDKHVWLMQNRAYKSGTVSTTSGYYQPPQLVEDSAFAPVNPANFNCRAVVICK